MHTRPIYELRVVRERVAAWPEQGPCKVCEPDTVARLFAGHFAKLDREHFAVLLLDGANQVLGFHTVSIGGLNSSLVDPRVVFKVALLAGAVSIILMHNHPSGQLRASAEDEALTQRLQSAGNLLGVKVLDHLIFGDGYLSFQEAGLLG